MAYTSLDSSIRSCKISDGWANKIQSDRFENPNLMLCPPWGGVDQFGRPVCPDSYWTKTAGCNSADDRVEVENALRPQYLEYVSLSAGGIKGDIYGGDSMYNAEENYRSGAIQDLYKITGSAGLDYNADIYPRCLGSAYEDAQAQLASVQRRNIAQVESYKSGMMRKNSGNSARQTFYRR